MDFDMIVVYFNSSRGASWYALSSRPGMHDHADSHCIVDPLIPGLRRDLLQPNPECLVGVPAMGQRPNIANTIFS